MGYQMVRPSEKNFGGQVPAKFATEGALNGDGLKRELPDAGWNVAAALLARDNEGLAAW
jgi:hypothetical protein